MKLINWWHNHRYSGFTWQFNTESYFNGIVHIGRLCNCENSSELTAVGFFPCQELCAVIERAFLRRASPSTTFTTTRLQAHNRESITGGCRQRAVIHTLMPSGVLDNKYQVCIQHVHITPNTDTELRGMPQAETVCFETSCNYLQHSTCYHTTLTRQILARQAENSGCSPSLRFAV